MYTPTPSWHAYFEKHQYQSKTGVVLPYRLALPIDAGAASYPLVIFLHGAGERGSDNEQQLRLGTFRFVREQDRYAYPCYVFAPQCPLEDRWVEAVWDLPAHRMASTPRPAFQAMIAAWQHLLTIYPIDPNRIYVVGISMGGFGTWELIQRYANRIAAAIPLCSGGDESLASRLVSIPIWAFHGDLDETVSVARSRNMIRAIQKNGGKPRYTEYPGVYHNCWDLVFDEPTLLSWLFAHRLNPC
jgi:predicted peptidase